MNGSPVATLVRGWVDLYTRGLPADLRDARRDEVDDDLWCEQDEAAAAGRSARSLDADLFRASCSGCPPTSAGAWPTAAPRPQRAWRGARR